jgi:hypothetical protein
MHRPVRTTIELSDSDLAAALADAEGAWSVGDVREWERAREEAWASWPAERSSTPTS